MGTAGRRVTISWWVSGAAYCLFGVVVARDPVLAGSWFLSVLSWAWVGASITLSAMALWRPKFALHLNCAVAAGLMGHCAAFHPAGYFFCGAVPPIPFAALLPWSCCCALLGWIVGECFAPRAFVGPIPLTCAECGYPVEARGVRCPECGAVVLPNDQPHDDHS